jgi:hypothetical protein
VPVRADDRKDGADEHRSDRTAGHARRGTESIPPQQPDRTPGHARHRVQQEQWAGKCQYSTNAEEQVDKDGAKRHESSGQPETATLPRPQHIFLPTLLPLADAPAPLLSEAAASAAATSQEPLPHSRPHWHRETGAARAPPPGTLPLRYKRLQGRHTVCLTCRHGLYQPCAPAPPPVTLSPAKTP